MSVREHFVSQFKQPHGYLGHLAGFIMANRPSNIERIDWTLELLDLKPTDHVLEVGFGPGIAIEKTSHLASEGLIVGIDHSATMLHQANKRNADPIQRGLVKLHLGTIDSLPTYLQPFDIIYSVNVVQFWDNAEKQFALLYDLLSSDGKIATTYMPRHSGATNADAQNTADEIAIALQAVGFRNIQIKVKPFKPVSAICVLAERANNSNVIA